jgi:hypothetical protein
MRAKGDTVRGMLIKEGGPERQKFPDFKDWKSSLKRAFNTADFSDYTPSGSIFERWYVPVRTADFAVPDIVIYQVEKGIRWIGSLRTRQVRDEKTLPLQTRSSRVLRAVMNSLL